MSLKNVDVHNWSSRVRDISAAGWARNEHLLNCNIENAFIVAVIVNAYP